MAATVINHLRRKGELELDAVLYIYCDYRNRTIQTSKIFLAAMLRQILQCRKEVPNSLLAYYDRGHGQSESLDCNKISEEFESLVLSFRRTFLVVDALDECQNDDGTRADFLCAIKKLQSTSSLRVLATSRFISEIADNFFDCPKLEVRASDEDIKQYAENQLRDRPVCLKDDELKKRSACKSIAEAASGMLEARNVPRESSLKLSGFY